MVMLQKIEKYAIYRAVLELIAHEEAFNKKKSTLSGGELFKLCHDRYLLMQQLLIPLKEKLGKEIEISNISFTQGFQDDTCIIVEYLKEENKCYFTVSHLEFDNVETICNTASKDSRNLINDNKNEFLKAFDCAYQYSFDKEIHVPTTTKHFVFSDDNETFSLKDSLNGETLNLSGSHLYYDKTKLLYIPKENISHYKNICKILTSDEEMAKVVNHTRIYEEDLPRILIKK